MQPNESDGTDGWPHHYASPWAPRDPERAERPWPRGNERGAAPAENRERDTIAFGGPDDGAWGYGRRSSVPPGDWSQPGYPSQPGYGEPPSYGPPPTAPPSYGPPPPPPPGSRRGRFLVYLGVAALAASIGAGVTIALDDRGAEVPASGGVSSSEVPVPHDNAAGSGSARKLNVAAVAAKVKPGLVDIIATLRYSGETAEGTGMIVSPSGLVLTNNHVIDQATSVKAALVTGSARTYQAKVLGYDATDDVALLQLVGASHLAAVSIGNSAQVRLGTPVLALGNADGRGGVTPAPGIINALNRSIQASDQGSDSTENLNHMLQTNARIQQGDSGGALANNAGQVIGMITAARTSGSGPYGGSGGTLGFAIPINSALSIARQIASGRASSTVYIGLPGFLGVEVAQSDSPDPQQQAADQQRGRGQPNGGGSACQTGNQPSAVPDRIAPASSGALVIGILCGTVAQSQGLAPGDVITSVNGRAVTTPSSLSSITARYHPGDVVSVSWADVSGARHTTSMRLGSGPAR